MADASEATLTDAVTRAFALSGDPFKRDAFAAVCGKGAAAFNQISDDLTRELYAFLSGFLSGICMAGVSSVGGLLDVMQAPGVRGDPAKMREALKTTWEAMTA